jgi:hypothetical protein
MEAEEPLLLEATTQQQPVMTEKLRTLSVRYSDS